MQKTRLFHSLAALLVACLLGCGGGKRAIDEASGEIVMNGRIDSALVGAWRVLGDGSLLDVRADGVTQYQLSPGLCYADPLGSTDDPADLAGQSFKAWFRGDQASAELFELAGAPSSATLERIAAIPAACRAPPATDPATSFKALCELMGQDYAFFAERQIDWAARCTSLAPRAAAAADDEALQAVLIAALDGFNDAHVKLYRGRGAQKIQVFSAANAATGRLLRQAFDQQSDIADWREFQLAWRDELIDQVEQRLSDSSGPQLDAALRWGRLPGNVGYIAFYRMIGFSGDATTASDVANVRAAMDKALAALAGTRSMIVDVSLNGGGQDIVSAEIAASFADQRRLVFTKQSRRPQGKPAQAWFVEPKGAQPYRKPVYLLTSDLTGSSAETFTLMMRQFPQVTQAGQRTAGSISDILEKSLPGNFSVSFASEIVRDPTGALYEVSGIPPRLDLPLFKPADATSLLSGHGAAITALLEIAGR